jgi:beta-xylosidase
MGSDSDGDGTGEPVLSYKKPAVGKTWPVMTPAESDEFNNHELGLQWQWHANPGSNWMFTTGSLGVVRLFNVPLPGDFQNFWEVPNLLLQKFPAPEFTATTKLTFTPRTDDEKIGLIVMGLDYSYLSVKQKAGALYLSQTVCRDADKHGPEKEIGEQAVKGSEFYLRVSVSKGAVCKFAYSSDGSNFRTIGEPFTARPGKWIGAKVGIFAVRNGTARESGYADFDWFRVE